MHPCRAGKKCWVSESESLTFEFDILSRLTLHAADYEKTNSQACKQSTPNGRLARDGSTEPCGEGLGSDLHPVSKWFQKDRNPLVEQRIRPVCEYRSWKYYYSQSSGASSQRSNYQTFYEYNCTEGDKPHIQDVCKFFGLKWRCLKAGSDLLEALKEQEGDEWSSKEWKGMPKDHPYYRLWEFKNPIPGSNDNEDQSIPGEVERHILYL